MSYAHPDVDFQLAMFEENIVRFGARPAYAPFKCFVGRDEEDAKQFEAALAENARVRTEQRGNLVLMYLRAA